MRLIIDVTREFGGRSGEDAGLGSRWPAACQRCGAPQQTYEAPPPELIWVQGFQKGVIGKTVSHPNCAVGNLGPGDRHRERNRWPHQLCLGMGAPWATPPAITGSATRSATRSVRAATSRAARRTPLPYTGNMGDVVVKVLVQKVVNILVQLMPPKAKPFAKFIVLSLSDTDPTCRLASRKTAGSERGHSGWSKL